MSPSIHPNAAAADMFIIHYKHVYSTCTFIEYLECFESSISIKLCFIVFFIVFYLLESTSFIMKNIQNSECSGLLLQSINIRSFLMIIQNSILKASS